jgi:Zn-dependent peptidase ImmA (M78 family)
VITVDAHEAPQRKRFTAAHELAHYLMHRDMLANGQNLHRDNLFGDAARWNDAAPFSPQHEVEANRFAAEMLMPRAQVRRWHSEFRGNVSELARKFNVSQAAMKIRLKNLGLPTA